MGVAYVAAAREEALLFLHRRLEVHLRLLRLSRAPRDHARLLLQLKLLLLPPPLPLLLIQLLLPNLSLHVMPRASSEKQQGVQVESTDSSFSQSKFETGRFQAKGERACTAFYLDALHLDLLRALLVLAVLVRALPRLYLELTALVEAPYTFSYIGCAPYTCIHIRSIGCAPYTFSIKCRL